MQDRRKQTRKDLMSYSQVYDLQDGKLIGYLGDLNLFGAMVISDHVMAENEKLQISIELPELNADYVRRLSLSLISLLTVSSSSR